MITTSGKKIIAKFLLGQAPAFATHIAAGIGADVLYPTQSASAYPYSSQQALEFEAFRVPITSRGFVKESGVEKIVFKGEMPSTYHYHISEIGFYSDGANSLAGSYDSKTLATFAPVESWTLFSGTSASTIASVTDESAVSDASGNVIWPGDPAIFMPTDGSVFYVSNRRLRNEGPRLQNKCLYFDSGVGFVGTDFSTASAAYAVQTTKLSVNLSQNLPSDEVRLAFSLMSNLYGGETNPNRTRIVLDLVNNISGLDNESPKARATVEYLEADWVLTGTGQVSDPTCRYKVAKFPLSSFTQDDGFSWANINLVRIYACTVDGSNALDTNYAFLFDGLRFENLTTENPLYALCGYDVVQATSGIPLEKEENTNNYIEYRFGVDVE